MIKPFYQGKLDTFCAIYAVLNGLRLLCGIRVTKARDILNSTLLSLGLHPARFNAFLNQTTDYLELVDKLLKEVQQTWRIEVSAPFQNTEMDSREFWQVCRDWMGDKNSTESGRTFVFRFLRYIVPEKPATNRHWSTVDSLSPEIMHLFDSSHEAEAILNIRKDGFTTSEKSVTAERLLLIPPQYVRFMRLVG